MNFFKNSASNYFKYLSAVAGVCWNHSAIMILLKLQSVIFVKIMMAHCDWIVFWGINVIPSIMLLTLFIGAHLMLFVFLRLNVNIICSLLFFILFSFASMRRILMWIHPLRFSVYMMVMEVKFDYLEGWRLWQKLCVSF